MLLMDRRIRNDIQIMNIEKFSVVKHVDNVIDHQKDGDNWLISTEVNGSPYDYISEHMGEIVFTEEHMFMCKFKDNKDVGDLLHKIMMGLLIKKLKCYSVNVFPVDYFVQEYSDTLHRSGVIFVQAEETNLSKARNDASRTI